MTAHPTLLDLMERSEDPEVREHVADCAICGARTLMLGTPAESAPLALPGLDEARRALADTRRLASLSIGHTWGTDPLQEDLEVPPDLEVGRTLDRYVVRDRIGAGAMGALYRVEHAQLGSRHALKVLHHATDSVRGRLIREGQAQSRLQHANVVPVTDVVDVDGAPGLIMEFVDGPSLSAWLRDNGPPELPVVARLGEQIIRAVSAAHAAGIVHRDLKPSNVLIAHTDEGPTAKVCDFGLALWAEHEEGRTGPLGTPGYMAPEQIHDASAVDARSDIFSLGAVLYELATGKRAFDAPDLLGVWTAIRAGVFEPPEDHRLDLPDSMADTIAIALNVEPDARFSDCSELLAAWRGGRPLTEEVPRPPPPRMPTPPILPPPPAAPQARPVAVFGALGVAVAIALGVVAFALRAPEPPAPVEPAPPASDRGDRRLTAMPAEYQIFAIALSPDDQELLYTDGRGLWHQSLESGATRLVAGGGPFHSVDWLPDGGGAVVSGMVDDTKGTWGVDLEEGALTALTEHSGAFLGVSPDGTQLALAKDDGIWVMGIDGSDGRNLRELTGGEHASALAWSPDGTFVAIIVQGRSTGTPTLERLSIDGDRHVLREDPRLVALGLSALEWTAPDRLLFARTGGHDGPPELRALVGASTAEDTTDSVVLRTWEDYAMIRLRAGGSKLVTSRGTAVQDVWLLDPEAPDDLRLLTPEEWDERPLGWGQEGILTTSNRGSGGLFVMDLERPSQPRRLFAPKGYAMHGYELASGLVLGKFIRPELPDGSRGEAAYQIERFADGRSTLLYERTLTESLGSATPSHALRCAAERCLVSTPEGADLAFRWLDTANGGLSEAVTTLEIRGRSIAWTLSPDAGELVALLADPAVRIDVDLATGATRTTDSELDLPLGLAWAADGSALYASGLSHQSVRPYRVGILHEDGRHEVLRASMNSNYHTLVSSPEGTSLALGINSFGTDVWLLDEL